MEHGAKPEALGLIRLSTSVQFPRLKVSPILRRLFLSILYVAEVYTYKGGQLGPYCISDIM